MGCIDFSSLLKDSAAIINRAGDKGSFCLRPLLEGRMLLATPFIKTEYQFDDTILHMLTIHLSLKLIFLIILIRARQFSESHALFISSLRTKLELLTYLLKNDTTLGQVGYSYGQAFFCQSLSALVRKHSEEWAPIYYTVAWK